MAIYQQCPTCKKRQSRKNRKCKCGEDLAKVKRSNRARYWVEYRMPTGKVRREPVKDDQGNWAGIKEAEAVEGKLKAAQFENRIMDVRPDSKWTFNDLAKWYLDLESVKSLASFPTRARFTTITFSFSREGRL
jgi:hypothetical protein